MGNTFRRRRNSGYEKAGREYADAYNEYGYVPNDIEGVDDTVSHTLEYAWYDGALSTLATALGKTEDAEKYKEKNDICNAIGAHHDEVEMESLLAPIVQVCDAISGARPGARREIVEAYIKRLRDLEQLAMSYPGVTKTYAIQAGRELRVIVGADKIDDKQTEQLSG